MPLVLYRCVGQSFDVTCPASGKVIRVKLAPPHPGDAPHAARLLITADPDFVVTRPEYVPKQTKEPKHGRASRPRCR